MTTYKDACLALGPITYVRLGETSGTVADDLGSLNLDGTYSGSYTQGIATDIGDGDTATQFTAAGSGQVAIPHDATLNLGSGTGTAWSVVFRVRIDGTPPGNFRGIMTKGGGTNGWLFYTDTTGTTVTCKIMGTQVAKASLLTVDTWAWVCVTNDGAQLEWFKDGASQGTSAFATAHAPSNTSAVTLALGDGTNYSNLTLDEVAIFDYQLTAQQVSDLYATWGNAPSTGTPVGQAVETETAQPVGIPGPSVNVGQAVETDAAPFMFEGAQTEFALPVSVETSGVFNPLVRTATEAETGLTITPTVTRRYVLVDLAW